MNYLAHIHLSFDNPSIAIGNFITDLLKPDEKETFSKEIQKGIELHHFIDRTTDSNPIFKETKKIFIPDFRHYAGVVVDIVYDHFLAKNFSQYHDLSLKDFIFWFYQAMEQEELVFPNQVNYVYEKLKEYNWFEAYQSLEGLGQVFRGMDNRTGFRSGMSQAHLVLQNNYDAISQQFELFYPELRNAVKEKLSR